MSEYTEAARKKLEDLKVGAQEKYQQAAGTVQDSAAQTRDVTADK